MLPQPIGMQGCPGSWAGPAEAAHTPHLMAATVACKTAASKYAFGYKQRVCCASGLQIAKQDRASLNPQSSGGAPASIDTCHVWQQTVPQGCTSATCSCSSAVARSMQASEAIFCHLCMPSSAARSAACRLLTCPLAAVSSA